MYKDRKYLNFQRSAPHDRCITISAKSSLVPIKLRMRIILVILIPSVPHEAPCTKAFTISQTVWLLEGQFFKLFFLDRGGRGSSGWFPIMISWISLLIVFPLRCWLYKIDIIIFYIRVYIRAYSLLIATRHLQRIPVITSLITCIEESKIILYENH